MSLEAQASKIIDKIISEARRQADQILSQARNEVEKIKEEQRQKALRKIQMELEKYRKELEETNKRALIEARFKAKESWLKTRESLIDEAFKKARERIATFVKTPRYPKVLEELIEEASIAIGGGSLIVQLNDKDADLNIDLAKLAKRITRKLNVITALTLSDVKVKTIGGAIVSTSDGRIVYDNTFEARLHRKERDLRLTVAKKLWGES
ncbi:MAG: V-type ATP synthase subunit E family protein [Candidatus Nezhaarchaeales archaeon]